MKRFYLFLTLFFFSLLLLFPQTSPGRKEISHVHVIHSYHQGLYWTDSISWGINDALDSDTVEIHYEYLDSKRNSGEEYIRSLSGFKEDRPNLKNINFEVIICSDNNALRFIKEYGETLYPGTPVVFCGINNCGLLRYQQLQCRDEQRI